MLARVSAPTECYQSFAKSSNKIVATQKALSAAVVVVLA